MLGLDGAGTTGRRGGRQRIVRIASLPHEQARDRGHADAKGCGDLMPRHPALHGSHDALAQIDRVGFHPAQYAIGSMFPPTAVEMMLYDKAVAWIYLLVLMLGEQQRV